MIKVLATTCLLIAISSCAFAQKRGLMELTKMEATEIKRGISLHEQPLVLINGQETTIRTLILSEDKIEEVNVYKKGTPEAAEHGQKGQNGLIKISPKVGINLIKYEEVLNKFEIPAAQRNLKVSINRGNLVNSELILADLSEIEKVEVTEAGAREFAQWGWNPGDKFLNIITKEKE